MFEPTNEHFEMLDRIFKSPGPTGRRTMILNIMRGMNAEAEKKLSPAATARAKRLQQKREYRERNKDRLKEKEREINKYHESLATLSIPVGTWVTYTPKGTPYTVRIVQAVPAWVVPQCPDVERYFFEALRFAAARLPRYLVQMPEGYNFKRPMLEFATAAMLERTAVIHEGRPLLPRLEKPIPNGTEVCWQGTSRDGDHTYRGKILGYVPAGQNLANLGLVDIKASHNVCLTSGRDRYVIQTGMGKGWLCPDCLLIEKYFQELEEIIT